MISRFLEGIGHIGLLTQRRIGPKPTVVGETPQAGIEGVAEVFWMHSRIQLQICDFTEPLDWGVAHQRVQLRARPKSNHTNVASGLKYFRRVAEEPAADEKPVVLAMKDEWGLHVRIRVIDRLQLPEAGAADECLGGHG